MANVPTPGVNPKALKSASYLYDRWNISASALEVEKLATALERLSLKYDKIIEQSENIGTINRSEIILNLNEILTKTSFLIQKISSTQQIHEFNKIRL